jgi:predicted thioesterase
MVALMEGAACEAIDEALPEGQTTVGIALSIEHLSATPVGLEVRAEAEVTAVEGKVITFDVTAYDEAGPIGKGTHKRCIVNSQKFLEKTYSKL